AIGYGSQRNCVPDARVGTSQSEPSTPRTFGDQSEAIQKRACGRSTDYFLEADLNEAALRRTHSRVAG
ncbi:MAG: hypothetical protein WBL63_09460, partial [Candidatus Acidiferrum sp.]